MHHLRHPHLFESTIFRIINGFIAIKQNPIILWFRRLVVVRGLSSTMDLALFRSFLNQKYDQKPYSLPIASALD